MLQLNKVKFFIFFILCLVSYSSFASKLNNNKNVYLNWFNKSCLKNVEQSLNNLPDKGKKVKLNSKGIFLNSKEYRNRITNKFGLDNHFQGITFNKESGNIYISGGNVNSKTGVLLVSNMSLKNSTISKRIEVKGNDKVWHAGAISKFQNYLLVPVERFKPSYKSEIQFYDLENPNIPDKIEYVLKVENDKTGAVDAVYDKKTKKILLFAFDTKSFTVYESNGDRIRDGFKLKEKVKSKVFLGAGMKVLQQCDGKVFFAEISNDGILPPILNGQNRVKLYRYKSKEKNMDKRLEFVESKKFNCEKYCNFRGAASLVAEDNILELVSSKMYREKNKDILKINLFQ